jgi:SAM-dependent MidA family methyltransferase
MCATEQTDFGTAPSVTAMVGKTAARLIAAYSRKQYA